MGEHRLFLFGLLCVSLNLSTSKSIQSAYHLYDVLLSNYTPDIRPVNDDNDILNVTTTLFLTAILDLDEPTGQLTSALSVNLLWNDILLTWNPADYEWRTKIEISKKKIWTPDLMLISPSQTIEKLGKENDKVLVYSYGGYSFLSFTVVDIFYTICNIDITYFPFDTQICEIRFALYDYGDRIRYEFSQNVMNMDYFYESGVWDVKKTELYTEKKKFNYDVVGMIHMKRRSTFYSLNLLAPIIILMFLDCMVFLLPAECGERVGFAVTILLSIAVYMTIISDELPDTSKPVSILTFILVTYLTQSSLICVCTIFGLRLFFQDESKPVSKAWCIFVRIMGCRCSRGRIANQNDERTVSHEDSKVDDKSQLQRAQKINWMMVAEMYHMVVFTINLSACFLVAIVYFGIVLSNT